MTLRTATRVEPERGEPSDHRQLGQRRLIVIPAFNEEQALEGTLHLLEAFPEEYDILVVDDGSTDRTGAIAENHSRMSARVKVVHLPLNSGIGASVQTGYLFAARGGCYEYVIQFDGDGQHPAEAIPQLVSECKLCGLDLCVGSRFLEVRGEGFRSTFARRLGIRFFAWLIRALTGTRVTDPTSGFRCAGRRAWAHFANHYPEDYPEPETLFWCVRNGLRIGEIPVRMHQRQGGASSIRRLRTLYYMIKVSLAILLDRLRHKEHPEK